MKSLLKLVFLISTVFLYSCDEENEVIIEPDAKLIWTGSYDTDGCGFFIEIDSIRYKPQNEGIIPPQFRRSQPLSITVQYIDLLSDIKYFCGDMPDEQKSKAIKLTQIILNEDLP